MYTFRLGETVRAVSYTHLVALLAGFAMLYMQQSKRDSKIKLVLLDEAFSKMDQELSLIHIYVAIIPELCEREQIEDPRERQLRLIARVEKWRRKGQDCAWLCSYYCLLYTSYIVCRV